MKNAKRYLAVVLSFALFCALPLAFTQEAAAASKTKIKQVSQVTTTYTGTDENGQPFTSTSVAAYKYNKKGLNSSIVYQDGSRDHFKYDKSGRLSSETNYSNTGAVEYEVVYNLNNGKVAVKNDYEFTEKGSAKLTGKTEYTYTKKKGRLKQKAFTPGNYLSPAGVTTYKKGVPVKYVYTTSEEHFVRTFDSNGNIASETITTADGGKTITDKYSYNNTYKKGKLSRVEVTYATDNGKVTYSGVYTYKYKNGRLTKATYTGKTKDKKTKKWDTYSTVTKYTYTKAGLIKTISDTSVSTDANGTSSSSSYVTSIKYKKVDVKSKYAGAVKDRMSYYKDSDNFREGFSDFADYMRYVY